MFVSHICNISLNKSSESMSRFAVPDDAVSFVLEVINLNDTIWFCYTCFMKSITFCSNEDSGLITLF